MALKRHTEAVHGRLLTFSYTGSPDHSPLLFLHGFGTFPPRYTPLLEMLGKRFHVLAPHVKATTLEEFASIADAFRQEYTTTPAHIVAHSTGAGAGLLLGHRAPIRSLAYINGPLPNPTRDTLDLVLGGALIAGRHAIGYRGTPRRTTAQTLARAREILTYLGANPRDGLRTIERLAKFDTYDLRVDEPTLILHTCKDEFFPPYEQGFAEVRAACPNSTLRILGDEGGRLSHEWVMYHPGLAWRELRKFYRAIDAGNSASDRMEKSEPVRI